MAAASETIIANAHSLFVQTFERNDLRLLLRLHLDKKLCEICAPDIDDSALFLSVIEWAHKVGRLGQLVHAAALERPHIAEWQQLRRRAPMQLGEIFKETHRLLLATFSRDDLRELLLTKMNARMATIIHPEMDNAAATLEVVEWFEMRGQLTELIREAAATRKSVPDWQVLLGQL